jgi:hypothetical protein
MRDFVRCKNSAENAEIQVPFSKNAHASFRRDTHFPHRQELISIERKQQLFSVQGSCTETAIW